MEMTYAKKAELLDQWARDEFVSFVNRSSGQYTTAAVSRESLMTLIEKALELGAKMKESAPGFTAEWTLYWGDGRREVIQGVVPIGVAVSRRGYGNGAIRDLDFYAPGNNTDYEFVDRRWVKKTLRMAPTPGKP